LALKAGRIEVFFTFAMSFRCPNGGKTPAGAAIEYKKSPWKRAFFAFSEADSSAPLFASGL
jgi:hypothetical protein